MFNDRPDRSHTPEPLDLLGGHDHRIVRCMDETADGSVPASPPRPYSKRRTFLSKADHRHRQSVSHQEDTSVFEHGSQFICSRGPWHRRHVTKPSDAPMVPHAPHCECGFCLCARVASKS
jgi:hypothetical protein